MFFPVPLMFHDTHTHSSQATASPASHRSSSPCSICSTSPPRTTAGQPQQQPSHSITSIPPQAHRSSSPTPPQPHQHSPTPPQPHQHSPTPPQLHQHPPQPHHRSPIKGIQVLRSKIDPMMVRHLKKRLTSMVDVDKNVETRVEDLAWLCSLSESEIDMLISLKLLIIQRAKMIDCSELANKFDLKMLRGIAFVLMEHLKTEVKDSSLIPDTVKSTAFLDACNLLKCNNEPALTIEELNTNIGADILTILGRPRTSKRKKQKVRSSEDN